MKFLLLIVLIITGFSCGKKNENDPNGIPQKCGKVLTTPVLDSFIYPTYYITTTVAFSDTTEIIHFHADVTGDHDGSWFLPKYSVDSSLCITP